MAKYNVVEFSREYETGHIFSTKDTTDNKSAKTYMDGMHFQVYAQVIQVLVFDPDNGMLIDSWNA